jgi:DNA-binding transcriptional regulator YiaG
MLTNAQGSRPMLNPLTTNERIRAVYEMSGMTYKSFARFLGVSPHAVESWFRPSKGKSARRAHAATAILAESLIEELAE